jgi:hypothetical protein
MQPNENILLLRFLGTPFSQEENNPPNETRANFFDLAFRNSIPLLYLEQLREMDSLGNLNDLYSEFYSRYLNYLEDMKRISFILNKRKVEHAIFKSFMIYPFAMGDIDVLILGSDEDYKRASIEVYSNYDLVGHGPQSITFRDPVARIGIDLYREIAVNQMIYLDKGTFSEHVVERRQPDDKSFLTLSSAADAVSIIAHSVIKEQMQKLSDYYFVLYHFYEMPSSGVDEFIRLARENYVEAAVRAYLTVVGTLHAKAHGFVPEPLERVLDEFNVEPIEELRLVKNGFRMPHKYHLMTLIKTLCEKLDSKKTRVSLASQLLDLTKPSLLTEVIGGVISHTKRESY